MERKEEASLASHANLSMSCIRHFLLHMQLLFFYSVQNLSIWFLRFRTIVVNLFVLLACLYCIMFFMLSLFT